jgi:hypothetical protein
MSQAWANVESWKSLLDTLYNYNRNGDGDGDGEDGT